MQPETRLTQHSSSGRILTRTNPTEPLSIIHHRAEPVKTPAQQANGTYRSGYRKTYRKALEKHFITLITCFADATYDRVVRNIDGVADFVKRLPLTRSWASFGQLWMKTCRH